MWGTDAYVFLVSRVEERLQQDRRKAATDRIARALEVSPRHGRKIYRQCLASEAREEADAARLCLSESRS